MTEGDALAALRRTARARRRALSSQEQAVAAGLVHRAVTGSAAWARARTVAAYVATDGELDPAPLLAAAVTAGKTVALPVVLPGGLRFRVDTGVRLPDRFGLWSPPDDAPELDGRELDLVLVPLVVADAAGGRAGRGAGYYDRAFAFRRTDPPPPYLIGLAHAVQLVAHVPMRAHDVRLDAVAVGDRDQLVVADLPTPAPDGP